MPVQTDSREQSKSKPPVRRNPDASRERILAAATDVFAVGLTLVGGISAGYVTSMIVVPALCSLLLEEAGRE